MSYRLDELRFKDCTSVSVVQKLAVCMSVLNVCAHVCVRRVHVHAVSGCVCMPLCYECVCLCAREPGEGGEGAAETRS